MSQLRVTNIISKIFLVVPIMALAAPSGLAGAQTATDSHLSPSSTVLITDISPPTISPSDTKVSQIQTEIKENNLIPGTYVNGLSFGYHEALRLAKENVIVGKESHDNFIDLKSGNILLSPDKDIVVGIGNNKINIGAKSIVFIMASENEVVVYNLHQTNPKKVFVIADKHKLLLEPCHLLALTSQDISNLKNLGINCRALVYQNEQTIDLGKMDIRAFRASFSLTSALATIEPLRRIVLSSNQMDNNIIQTLTEDIVLQDENSATIKGSRLSK